MKLEAKEGAKRMAFTELDEETTDPGKAYKSFDSERKPRDVATRLDLSDVASESGSGTSRKSV